jgi:hypothetical protein
MTEQMLDFSAPATDESRPRLSADERQRLCDRMALLFRSRPGEPIDVSEQAAIGGVSGYRTRVSDCRRYFGMDIRPEKPMARWPDGKARPRAIYTPAPHHGRPSGAQRREPCA